MLDDLVARDGPPVGALEATVTADNEASLRTFQRFAERHRAPITTTELFAGPQFPDGHEPEVLLTIGPLH
jgi:L-2,4-diaminobutyric acid acetyltransferase